jgi:hypothetical protein
MAGTGTRPYDDCRGLSDELTVSSGELTVSSDELTVPSDELTVSSDELTVMGGHWDPLVRRLPWHFGRVDCSVG